MNKKIKSFTLIEILVVVSVIGLLSSIILVNLKGARKKAEVAKSLEFNQSVFHFLGSEAVAILDFDEGGPGTCSGGGDICDRSGNGNHGVNYGAEWKCESEDTASGKGCALSFNGSSYVEIPDSPSLALPANDETVLFWVKHDHSQRIFSSNGNLRILMGSGWNFIDTFDSILAVSSPGNNDNNWHLVGYVISGVTVKSYVDGKLVDERATFPPRQVCCPATFWWLGRACNIFGHDCDKYYTGLIDNVYIYNKALTVAEVQRHYVEELKHCMAMSEQPN